MANAVEAQGATGIGATFRLGGGISTGAWAPDGAAFWNVALAVIFLLVIGLVVHGLL